MCKDHLLKTQICQREEKGSSKLSFCGWCVCERKREIVYRQGWINLSWEFELILTEIEWVRGQMEAAMASFWCPVAPKLLLQQAILQPTFGKRTSVPSRSRCVRAGGFVRGDGKLGRGRLVISNGIRAVESFDAAFQLVPEVREERGWEVRNYIS